MASAMAHPPTPLHPRTAALALFRPPPLPVAQGMVNICPLEARADAVGPLAPLPQEAGPEPQTSVQQQQQQLRRAEGKNLPFCSTLLIHAPV